MEITSSMSSWVLCPAETCLISDGKSPKRLRKGLENKSTLRILQEPNNDPPVIKPGVLENPLLSSVSFPLKPQFY